MLKFYLFGRSLALACLLCIFATVTSLAQSTLTLPEASQRAEVTQRIGLTDISIVYHSPDVKGRQVWDNLVPYNAVWRAGANENTAISFTDDVTINGQALPAGTYGLHMIPTADEWTVIFSKNHTSWGSYFYKKEEDALRVKVKPQPREHQEWLDYTFGNRKVNSADVILSWEKLKVPFTVGVDVHAVTLRHIREQLRNMAGFNWHGWEEAAHYCIMNKINYDEALTWINKSLQFEQNFANVAAKGQLLNLMGKTKEADDESKKLMALMENASETQVNQFGYELMNENDMKTALDAFRLNVKKHPESWNAYDSMAEALANAGDKKQAISHYKLALEKAPEDQKARIKKTITTLEKS